MLPLQLTGLGASGCHRTSSDHRKLARRSTCAAALRMRECNLSGRAVGKLVDVVEEAEEDETYRCVSSIKPSTANRVCPLALLTESALPPALHSPQTQLAKK